ncbi:MAG: DoxX family protein [Verrucomicrobiae bacterium]|nr:DoxX family protein [Verrucomicrobiae bacterium]
MKQWLPFSGRLFLGALFILAGGLKVADPKAFARVIVDYALLPDILVPAVAVLLPWWELVAGALAIAGPWRRGALAVLTALSAMFVVVGSVTLARGLSPECGCFGNLSSRLGPGTLSLEVATLALSAWLLRLELLGRGTLARKH